MADTPTKVGEPPRENQELRYAIHAFEQILEIMPNDLASLESSWRAYAELDDNAQSIEILIRLADALADQDDATTARRILHDLAGAGYDDPRIRQVEDTLKTICGDASATAPAPAKPPPGLPPLRHHVNVADELSFAWYLMEKDLINREEYSKVAEILAEMSSQGEKGTISVLHALETQNFTRMGHLIEAVSNDLATPFIDLSAFDIGMGLARKLPGPFMVGRGVLPFEEMEDQAILITLLNPYDKSLQDEITTALGCRCFFFITAPSAFDTNLRIVLERLAEAQADRA